MKKKVYAIFVLLFFVIGLMPGAIAQRDYDVREPQQALEKVATPVITENQTLISPQKQVVAIKGQEKVEVKSNQVLTIANRSIVAVEQNVINIKRTSKPVLLKPTEDFDFVCIENTSLDVRQIKEPLIAVEIETPERAKKGGGNQKRSARIGYYFG